MPTSNLAKPKVSVYIIAYNEAKKIAAAIKTVLWADEIIIVDSYSTDDTVKIATDFGAKVVQVQFNGFGDLRNQAILACQHDWIFSLDSDERCTQEAKQEILSIINTPNALAAYYVPRKNIFLGRWIKRVWSYPDYRQPQLFRRGQMKYSLEQVHEGFCMLNGKNSVIGHMKNAIWQIPYYNIQEMLYKANRYSSLGAEKLFDKKIKGSVGKALGHATWVFIRLYILKLGFLDGFPGFLIAFANFEGTLYRYVKLLEKDIK